jgi:serine/threonine protein kinase
MDMMDKISEFNITNNITRLITESSNNNLPSFIIKDVISYTDRSDSSDNLSQKIIKFNDMNPSDKLGDGGFGTVYKSYSNLDNNHYAIKQVPLDVNKYKKYLNEVQILSKLNHKNVIRYNSSWITRPESIESEEYMLNIQMELCMLNLTEYLIQRNNYKLEYNYKLRDAYHISKEINEGLEYLHQNNIIHADLSSQNIFITSGFEIKIGDFGLSHSVYSNDIFDINDDYGNPIYQAPEILDYKICKESDIYSYGILLFELFNCFETSHQRMSLIRKLKNRQIDENDLNLTIIFNPKDKLIKSYLKLIKWMTNDKHHRRPLTHQIKYELLDLLVNQ